MVTLFPTESNAQARRELKKMCRQQFRECKKEHSQKYCGQLKRECRRENELSFADDLELVKNKVLDWVQHCISNVEVKYGDHEEHGEYLRFVIEGNKISNMNDFYYSPVDYNSYLEVLDRDFNGEKEIYVVLFYSELEQHELTGPLQTTDGRLFPRFINGIKYPYIYGLPFQISGQTYHFYIDMEQNLVGLFVPNEVAGGFITFLNDIKNRTLLGRMIPNINSIPVTIRKDSEPIGRLSVLSDDYSGENSGYVVLFDIRKLEDTATLDETGVQELISKPLTSDI